MTLVEQHYTRYASVDEAVDKYLELCSGGLSAMDYSDPVVQLSYEPHHIPPAMGQRQDLERVFTRAQARVDPERWQVWLWSVVHRHSLRECSKLQSARVRSLGGEPASKSTINNWSKNVSKTIEEELSLAGLWDSRRAYALTQAKEGHP